MSLVKTSILMGIALIFLTQIPLIAQPLSPETESRIESVRDKVVAWRRDIHQHPELGNREFRTAEMVAEHLQSLGIEVQTGVAHTGVVGVLRGGVRSNIIPEQLEMMGTMRALHPQDRLDIIEHMHSIVTNTAAAMGVEATLTLPVTTSYPVTYNNLELTETVLPVIKAVAGEDKVMQYKPVMGAEDFSYYAQEVPGLFLSLGGRPSDVAPENAAPHHTPDFFVTDAGLQLGVRTFIALTLDYMARNPD